MLFTIRLSSIFFFFIVHHDLTKILFKWMRQYSWLVSFIVVRLRFGSTCNEWREKGSGEISIIIKSHRKYNIKTTVRVRLNRPKTHNVCNFLSFVSVSCRIKFNIIAVVLYAERARLKIWILSQLVVNNKNESFVIHADDYIRLTERSSDTVLYVTCLVT